MLIDFISTLSVGALAACLALVVNHLSGRRVPKWLLPAGVGLSMLGFTIWNEYSWYPRILAALPEGVVIASAPADRVIYRPWTYLKPLVTRFVAVDKTAAVPSTAQPDMFMATAVVIQRWAPTQSVAVAFDCAKGVRADLPEGARLDDNGTLEGTQWRPLDAADVLVAAACKGG
ncbi:MAG: hypothetical protein WBC68_13080 [Albidovulum sp.]